MDLQRTISKYILQGVYIITARYDDKLNGMTAAWVSQVSFNPLLLAVSVAPERYTYELIKASERFCVNVLGRQGTELAEKFGFTSGRYTDKFKDIQYSLSRNQLPVLRDAIAYFECELVNEFEVGDHFLLVGKVTDYGVLNLDDEPLRFRWEDYF